jgi:regulator of replication initiation timing
MNFYKVSASLYRNHKWETALSVGSNEAEKFSENPISNEKKVLEMEEEIKELRMEVKELKNKLKNETSSDVKSKLENDISRKESLLVEYLKRSPIPNQGININHNYDG